MKQCSGNADVMSHILEYLENHMFTDIDYESARVCAAAPLGHLGAKFGSSLGDSHITCLPGFGSVSRFN